MGQEVFRERITQVMDTQWNLEHPSIPVAYQNQKFNQPAGSWVNFAIIPNERYRTNIGSEMCYRQSGILNIALMVAEGSGTKTLNAMVDTIHNIFQDRDYVAGDGTKITFFNAETRDRGVVSGYYTKNVMVEFFHDQ